MTLELVTTFNQDGYNLYGREFINTFVEFWPEDVTLHVYSEGTAQGARMGDRVFIHSYEERCPLGVAFKKNEDRPEQPDGYRFEVDKFSHKSFSIASHMRDTQADRVALIDADIVTHRPVDHIWLDALMPMSAHVACLLRPWYHHTECGFVLYNVSGKTRDMVQTIEDVYTSGHVFNLPGWCDSSVFDYVRTRFEDERELATHNLTQQGQTDGLEVFNRSILGACMTHNKGAKKYGDHQLRTA